MVPGVRRLTLLLLVIGLFITAQDLSYAQQASITGTVTDSTGGVLPETTVTAVHEASGNTFVTVSDESGAFAIRVRTGTFRLTAELQGFTTVTRTGIDLLLGQEGRVNLQMVPATVQESVTVTGETPLIDVSQSSIGGNVDPRQIEELPVNGRNWQVLSMLAPGSRANAVSESPVPRDRGDYQLNVDGQQVTMVLTQGGLSQPRYSQDAIAEFEVVSSRFDARQGRSSGAQINAITKSGTNTFSGTVAGYFRDDRFNASDFVARRVLPYSDQQASATLGGPIRKDTLHFFANYEFEREPQTFSFTTPFRAFNADLTAVRREQKSGVRMDVQFSPASRLAVRGNKWANKQPYDPNTGGGDRTAASAIGVNRYMDQLLGTLTQVPSSRTVNEFKAGYAGFHWYQFSHVNWPNHPLGPGFKGAPAIQLTGLTIGQTQTQTPQRVGQETYSVRDDFSLTFSGHGQHDVRVGGEYIYNIVWEEVCNRCMGILNATGGPIPGNIESLFPNLLDASTWNLAALSPITRSYTQTIGEFTERAPRHEYAAWIQHDWKMTPRLTLNLGMRYDLYDGAFAEWLELAPFLSANRPLDTNNFSPRLGVAYSLDQNTVLRGGYGKYFAEVGVQFVVNPIRATHQIEPLLVNDGRPDFAANPFNGPAPRTYEEALRLPRLRRSGQQLGSSDLQFPYSHQASIGFQRQLGVMMALQADYVFSGARHELLQQSNINLSYNPDTGVNYPFTDVSRAPFPDWGTVGMYLSQGRSNYHALQTSFNKRFGNRWQASATYTLSRLRDADPLPYSHLRQVSFPVARDLGGEYSLATTDQRHRAVVSGVWEMGYGFQVSGLYFYGSGMRFATTYGADFRNTGVAGGRLRPDGTIVPRNDLVGRPLHRVDARLKRRFGLVGRTTLDGMVDVFNMFNHANYGGYVTQQSARNYGQPTRDPNVAYQPRMLQFGVRLAF